MKKLVSLMLVITMILGTITMTNVFVANAAGIDDNLVFDLDFSAYVADTTSTTDADGIKNAVTGTSTEITYVKGMVKGSETINGQQVDYIESSGAAKEGINIVNSDINTSPDITLETWVKYDTVAGHMFLYGNSGNWQLQVCSAGAPGYNWIFKDVTGIGSASIPVANLEHSKWNHLVVTLDRDTGSKARNIIVYMNGTEISRVESADIGKVYSSEQVGTNAAFRISSGDYSTAGSNTKYADVKLYTGLMTEVEAKAKYESEVGKYVSTEVEEVVPIEEKLEFDLGNISGYDPEAEDTETDKSKGLINEAVEENQSAEFIEVDSMVKGSETINGQQVDYIQSTANTGGIDIVNAAINESPDITVEAWVKDETISGHMFLYGNKMNNKWQLAVLANGGAWLAQSTWSNNEADKASASFPADTTKWRHVVVTLDRDTGATKRIVKTYVDGKLINTGQKEADTVYSATDDDKTDGTKPPFRISGGSYADQGVDTKFADVKLYSGVMTDEEVMGHYLDDRDKYTQKKKVFSLDVDDYNPNAEVTETDKSKGFANSAGNTSTIEVIGAPVVGTEKINDIDVKFLQPITPGENGGAGTYNGSIKVVDPEIMGNTALTIESWMRWDPDRRPATTSSYNGHLVAISKGQSGTNSLQLHDTNTNPVFRADMLASSGADTISMSDANNKNKWIHYVATREYDQTTNIWTAKVYVNGTPVGTGTRTASDTANPFYDNDEQYFMEIGSYLNANNTRPDLAFNGDIGTFNVYNYALTQTDAAANYEAEKGTWEVIVPEGPEIPWYEEDAANPTPNLVFDLDISAYNGTDIAGIENSVTGNSSTIIASALDSSATASPVSVDEGNNRKSLRFLTDDGKTKGIQVTDPAITGNTEITIEAWVKPTPLAPAPTNGHLLAISNGSAHSMQWFETAGAEALTSNLSVGPYGSKNITRHGIEIDKYANKWTQIVLTRKFDKTDTNNLKWVSNVYINGALATNTPIEYNIDSVLDDDTYKLYFGSFKNYPFEGNVGDLKVYNYALPATAEEGTPSIASIYAEGKAYWCPPVNGMFFDLDLDEYDTTTKKIENSVAYNNSDITVSGTPGIVIENTTAGIRRSLDFTEAGGVWKDDPETEEVETSANAKGKGYFSVHDSDMIGKENLTIEAWIKQKSYTESYYSSGHAFILTNGSKHSFQLLMVGERDYTIAIKPAGNYMSNADGTAQSTAQEWTHVVVAREYDKDAKAWDAYIYINGVLRKKNGEPATEAGVPTYDNMELEGINEHLLEDENFRLDVGAYKNSSLYYPGYIGELKMYNTKQSAEAIKASYDATKALYRAEKVDGAICVGNTRYLNKDSVEIENLISTDDKVTAKCKIINYTEAAVTPGVALLGYYENDVLQKVMVDTTNVAAFGTIQPRATSPEYEISIEGIAPKAGSYLRLFVWDGLDTLAPVVVNEADMKLEYSEDAAND